MYRLALEPTPHATRHTPHTAHSTRRTHHPALHFNPSIILSTGETPFPCKVPGEPDTPGGREHGHDEEAVECGARDLLGVEGSVAHVPNECNAGRPSAGRKQKSAFDC